MTVVIADFVEKDLDGSNIFVEGLLTRLAGCSWCRRTPLNYDVNAHDEPTRSITNTNYPSTKIIKHTHRF